MINYKVLVKYVKWCKENGLKATDRGAMTFQNMLLFHDSLSIHM